MKTPIYPLRIQPEMRKEWEKAAKTKGITLAEWIKATCSAAAMMQKVSVEGRTRNEKVASLQGEKQEVSQSVQKRLQAQKAAVKHKFPAVPFIGTVATPQKTGEMTDLHRAAPDLTSVCKHHKGYGELCYKCDPKMGYPEITA